MSDNPNSYPGFVPCGVEGQGEYKGTVRKLVHPASDDTAVYKYSFVKYDGGADSATGLPTVIAAGGTDTFCGIVIGMVPDPTDLNTHYCPASTRRILLVATDSNLYFKCIGDDVGTTLNATHQGLNVDRVAGTPSTITGHGQDRLDSSTVDTTNTLTVRIVALEEAPGMNIADGDKYKVFVCKANLHQDSSTTGV